MVLVTEISALTTAGISLDLLGLFVLVLAWGPLPCAVATLVRPR